jgi:hypothetical protein
MKILFLIILLAGGASMVQAQEKPKLKDLLYKGKLKKDSTGVIRSTDDLSSKIDTSTKKIDTSAKKDAQAVNTNVPAVNTNAPTTNVVQNNNAVVPSTGVITTAIASSKDSTKVDSVAVPVTTTPPKSNSKIWKEYTDSLTNTLQESVLKSKQIKKDTYFLLIDYEIATDGQVTFINVTSSPENSFLQAQVRQILDSTPLRLSPTLDSNNQPKKVKRRQQFSVTKE